MTIFFKANWENIIMANCKIDPIILPFLPKVELDLYNGKALYIGLVGFMFRKLSYSMFSNRGLATLKKSIYDFM
jgi:hypothetical protein